jgi:hypothetical protein
MKPISSGARWRSVAAAAALQLAAGTAMAMTEAEAATNLMHFAFAMKGAEQCDKLGYPSMAAQKRWEKSHAAVLVNSLKRIEQHAAASGKVTPDQAKDVALGLFVRFKDRYDEEMAPTVTGKSCMRFNETLSFYGTRLVD